MHISPTVTSRASLTPPPTDVQLRAWIRAELPATAFRRRPWRIVYAPLIVVALVTLNVALAVFDLPIPAKLVLALCAGNLYATLMFFGHEVAHGAVVRSRLVQDLVLGLGGFIFGVTPSLWRTWHHSAHHAHTNVPEMDPDNFGTIHTVDPSGLGRRLRRLAPGHGRWLSAAYLAAAFTLQVQAILWQKSRNWRYPGFSRRKAAMGSAAILSGWAVLGWAVGWPRALWMILIPMAVANFITMGYIVTNHWVRPLDERGRTLMTTMSVTTLGFLDLIHFHFSHHVEHHLFPGIGSSYYPLVRRSLIRYAGERYLRPPHWLALLVVLETPRLYRSNCELIDPERHICVDLMRIEQRLRAGKCGVTPVFASADNPESFRAPPA